MQTQNVAISERDPLHVRSPVRCSTGTTFLDFFKVSTERDPLMGVERRLVEPQLDWVKVRLTNQHVVATSNDVTSMT